MKLTDLLPYILPKAKGCAEIVALFNARLAIIELCQKALIWREYQDAQLTTGSSTAFEWDAYTGQQVCMLLGLTLNGETVDIVDPATGKARDATGTLTPYAYGTFTGFELRPVQSAGLPVVAYCAMAPSITTDTVPDALAAYVESIATGTLYRLYKAKDKDYSDPNGAILALGEWNEAIADAKTDALTGFARATTRTSKVWW
jgi:hypothetical protein